MEKIKVIDLLNKIANGEEIPHIQYDDVEAYIGADGYLKDNYGDNVEWWIDKKWLNTEVEIIEEDKKIEKWNEFAIQEMLNDKDIENIKRYIQTIMETQNEIIDYINKEEK